jgi:hypothetical protein
MDLESLKKQAVEATTRAFLEKDGVVPDPDSEEWEDEYRRQFARAKAGQPVAPAPSRPAVAPAAPLLPPEPDLPALSGPPSQARWAATLRDARLKEVESDDLRAWLAGAWTAAKDWLDTRELAAAAFRRRAEAEYAEHRRRLAAQSGTLEAERRAKAEAAAAITEKIRAAGITARGLIDLVDVSPRTKPAPAKAKLADLHADERRLRVFETTNPATLLVIESGAAGRSEYGIERDEGLAADLKLFGEADLT